MTTNDSRRPGARDFGIAPGVLAPGPANCITDVAGVLVGHTTLIEGDSIRTGVTAILPHGDNLFQDRVPAGLAVGNGFGKLMGATQIVELGEIESPVVLTNTLCVPRAAEALIDWTLAWVGNREITSVNSIVGETNDGYLNDIRARAVSPEHVLNALNSATANPVVEGCVGAGTGTVAFGWKGGIGTSSRRLPKVMQQYTVGVLVQSNYGGVLQIGGVEVGKRLGRYFMKEETDNGDANGSIMMILATDAPLSDRNLSRLASRAMAGLARTGSAMSNGSGDYAIAFSTAQSVRRTNLRRSECAQIEELPNDLMSPLFQAAIEATEEAIYNSLFAATTTTGYKGRTVEALPLTQMRDWFATTRGQGPEAK